VFTSKKMTDERNTTDDSEQNKNNDSGLNLEADSAADAEILSEVVLGEPSREYKDSNTELNVSGVPDVLNPSVDWFYAEGEPVLYIYDAQSEEPAFLIALPTEDDPTARLIGQREWTDEDWFENH